MMMARTTSRRRRPHLVGAPASLLSMRTVGAREALSLLVIFSCLLPQLSRCLAELCPLPIPVPDLCLRMIRRLYTGKLFMMSKRGLVHGIAAPIC